MTWTEFSRKVILPLARCLHLHPQLWTLAKISKKSRRNLENENYEKWSIFFSIISHLFFQGVVRHWQGVESWVRKLGKKSKTLKFQGINWVMGPHFNLRFFEYHCFETKKLDHLQLELIDLTYLHLMKLPKYVIIVFHLCSSRMILNRSVISKCSVPGLSFPF